MAYNTPPLANAGGPYAVNEGSSIVLDGAASSDAEQGPSTLTYTWDLDNDGTYETAGQSVTFSAAALDGPSSATVGLRVCDNLGVCATATGAVTVQNVAPAVTATGGTAVEGGSVTVSGSLTDPGTADAHTVVINWGPGNGTTTLNLAPGALTFLATRTFADDAALSAMVTVTDDDGASGSANAGVAVSNVAPLATLSGAATAPVGQPYVVTGTYADAGLADTHTVTVTWETGSSETFAVSGGTFTASHQYATSGARTITACVTDDDGGSGCATVSVSVANAAAKITGGGLRTASNGRGGFNVQSDGTTISGQLQFQSSLGTFHASRFTSLGVSGDGRSATFAGIGTDGLAFTAYVEDNGEPGRNDVFRLWIDGVLQNGSGAMSGGNIQLK